MKNLSAILAVATVAALWAITGFSESFSAYPQETARMPIAPLVALLSVAAVFYFAAIRAGESAGKSPRLAVVFIIGLVMRLAGLFSHPVLEDDYFRYLWDGAVTAAGENPYLFAPAQVLTGGAGDALKTLAQQSGGIAEKINHPHLTTIYPAAAQMFFALSHMAAEWSVSAWRLVLLAADCATFFLLVRLRAGKATPAIYWWNPLVVFTIFFSCHLEALIFPFVLGALLAVRGTARARRGILALALLCVSVAVKMWMVVLAAPVLRALRGGAKQTATLFALFCVGSLAVLSPLLASLSAENSGLGSYVLNWENNSSFFRIVAFVCEKLAFVLGLDAGHGSFSARIVTAAIIALGAAWAFFSKRWEPSDLARRCLFVSALVFLVIPAQFPWYYCWVVPFLALRTGGAKWSLMAPTALMPLYYIKYGINGQNAFGALIVWIQFAPVWIMLAWEHLRRKIEF
ncbi:MAG: hypothetical protein GKS04_00165 [Candidatus Mycalebacterium zealandia]|nr:MAG: hypothetical protein GKS04_00165 [Candidatus Mycalebacterium zealandia]